MQRRPILYALPTGFNLRLGQVIYDRHFAFEVGFDNVNEMVRGRNPVKTLNSMADEVESIVKATESECRQIGLIP